MNELKYHEIANIFPMMSPAELTALADDIKENGLQNKIVLFENKILDGRNRYKACRMAGINPEFDQYKGTDPLRNIISLNLRRRHLDESQRAVVASRVANMTAGRNWDNSANLRNNIPQSEAAKMFNVSERMIQTVKAIERDAPGREQQVQEIIIRSLKAYFVFLNKEDQLSRTKRFAQVSA